MKLACQELLLPGKTLIEKWEYAQSIGLNGIELQATSILETRARSHELREASGAGCVISSICLAGGPFIGEFDASKRRVALERMMFLLETAAESGAQGVITPAAWGLFSKHLPPFYPPRNPEDDRAVLLEGLHRLGPHASSLGTRVFLEPLNRYADHMINTLEQAMDYIETVGFESVKIIADLYHMNIEEARIADAIRKAAKHIGYVHLSDSNRLEPGAGHTDFKSAFDAFRDTQFEGFMALECRLSVEARDVLPKTVEFIRSMS